MNPEHFVLPGIIYIHNMSHRNGNPNKSQWLIELEIERDCFIFSHNLNWLSSPTIGWGLHIVNNFAAYLGCPARKDDDRPQNLFVAKFVAGSKDKKWHGYPADPSQNQDIPPSTILNVWLQTSYLRPAIIRKLSKGQKCKL